MRKNSTVLFLCGLFLLAGVLTIKQTIDIRAALSWTTLTTALIAEVASVFALGIVAFAAFRKTYRRQKKPISRVHLEPLRP